MKAKRSIFVDNMLQNESISRMLLNKLAANNYSETVVKNKNCTFNLYKLKK